MPQETEQVTDQLPVAQMMPEAITDEKIGPTVPRLEVQIVNKTTEVNNYQRRIDSINAEFAEGTLSEQDRADALEDIQFTEEALQIAQGQLDDLIAERSGATAESMVEEPIGQSAADIEALTDEAEALAGLANIPTPKE